MKEPYTATMAKLYADQGHLARAAEIYHQLLQQSPERDDLQQALRNIERQITRQNASTRMDLSALFQQWVRLMMKYNNLKRLRHFDQRRKR